MMDRSELMSRIRSTETEQERLVRKKLRQIGLRGYRKNWKRVIGRPDIAWPGRKIAIFLDGCFWHCCPVHFRMPKTNTKFWEEKMRKNKERDKKADRKLGRLGWIVLHFWEHELVETIVDTIEKVYWSTS